MKETHCTVCDGKTENDETAPQGFIFGNLFELLAKKWLAEVF